MTGVLEERAAIEREIAGRTVCDQLREAAESDPDAPAYSDPVEGGWSTLTYSEARQRVLEIAAGFAALGLEPGEAVALMMVNRSEHVLADLGAVHAGAVSCSVYSTFTPEQVAFVAGDVKAKIAVLGGPAELARWEPVLDDLPELRKVIVLEDAPAGDRFVSWDDFLALGRDRLAADPAVVDARWQAVTADDVLTVLYTSGTTGNPKGVPLTHSNVFFEVVATNRMADLPSKGTQISYLTYAHIAERVLSLYLPLFKLSHTHFCTDLAQLGATLGQVKPVLFFGVPRVWEKMMARLQALLATQPEEQQEGVRNAMAAGLAYIEANQYGRTPSPGPSCGNATTRTSTTP
ncbi:AMP-binding protein, partial [Streptosporangium sp. NPDC001682]